MDPICPPSTVFGVYHELTGPKSSQLWECNGHEGGAFDDERGRAGVGRAVPALTGVAPLADAADSVLLIESVHRAEPVHPRLFMTDERTPS